MLVSPGIFKEVWTLKINCNKHKMLNKLYLVVKIKSFELSE